MLKWFTVIVSFYTSLSFSGVTDLWFKFKGIDCETSSIEASKTSLTSFNETIICNSFNHITKGELENLISSSKNIRVDLETWIYLQNSSKLLTEEAKRKIPLYKDYQSQLKQPLSKDLERIKKNYNLLHALYQKKSILDKAINACKNTSPTIVPLMGPSDRFTSNYNCFEINTPKYQEESSKTNQIISDIEMLNPQFLHPHFQKEFENNQHSNFKTSYDLYLTKAISELETKVAKHTQIQSLEMSKENLESLLDSQAFLSEVTAYNYSPDSTVFYSNETNSAKITGLKRAQCISQQKLIAHETDDILLGLGKDIALLVSPFAIQAKISMFIRSVKFYKNLTKAKQTASTAMKTSEVTLAMVDQGFNVKAQSECSELSITLSHENTITDVQQEKLDECRDLADAMMTNSALALLGGGVAIKFAKFDIQSMRLDRIYAHGRKLANQVSGTVSATLIKQADLIQQQLETMFPNQQMAHAGGLPTNAFNQSAEGKGNLSGTLTLHGRRKESSGVAHLRQTILNFDCGGSSECSRTLSQMRTDLIELGKIQPDGLEKAHHILGLIRSGQFFKFPSSLQRLYHLCLGSLKCSPKEYDLLYKMSSLKINYTPHSYFYRRILNRFRLDASEETLNRNLTVLASNNLNPNKGKIIGSFNQIKKYDDYTIVNGKKYSNNDPDLPVLLTSLAREDEAVRLLAKKGFKVNTLPETIEARRARGLQVKFEELAKIEKIGRNKNPDLILNDNYIADIYSPLHGLSDDNLETIARGMLSKVEGKDKFYDVEKYTNDVNEYRQTNRVVVYVDRIVGDPEALIRKLRSIVGQEEPEHLEESFVIYDNNGTPEVINIWP